MLLRKHHLLIGLAICALLYVAAQRTFRITPLLSSVAVATTGSFEIDGHYPGKPFGDAVGVRAWGSWSGSDDNEGSLTLGPFAAPRVLRFGLGGYPDHAGNALRVERVDTGETQEIKAGAVGERWHVFDFEVPRDWEGRPIRLHAIDAAKGLGGWLGVTEPIRGGRSDANNALLQSLSAWTIHGLLLGLVYFAALPRLAERSRLPACWLPLAAGAIVASCGYVTFWAYFAHALIGKVVSWLVLATAAWLALRSSRSKAFAAIDEPKVDLAIARAHAAQTLECRTVLQLMAVIGAFNLGLLHLFPTQHDFYTLAANRYRVSLPSDNVLPHTFAERLFASEPLKNPIDEWLSSDRPPLQTGWQLLTWPASKALQLDRRLGSGTSAVWFQLLWVPAAYGLLRTLQVQRARAAGWIAAMAVAGFFVQNTIYTWPKLSAGAFACGAFAVLVLLPTAVERRRRAWWAALFAALAWLAHGGVAFSFLPLLPVLAWWVAKGHVRALLPGTIVFLTLALPWLAYQKIYDPPANRLLKWHLAGVEPRDARGVLETMRDSYAKIGWSEAWSNKLSNLHSQVFGDWNQLWNLSSADADARRHQEFFHTGRALTWWPLLAIVALAVAGARVFSPSRELGLLGGWLVLTIAAWCLLMFGRYSAAIHQGSYALLIGLFVFFSVILDRGGRVWLAMIVVLQVVTLATTYAIGNAAIHGPATGLPFTLITAAGLATFVVGALRTPASVHSEDNVALAAPAILPSPWKRWWQTPRLTIWVLLGLAIVLLLRKPHALTTPQLWAEDGSIFLMQADLHGADSLWLPYMGYLHTLPRVIAFVCSRLFDPALWPALYNAVAFAIWLAVLARFFSSRFDLPQKPWLALALILVPHTGEVYFNITNLQWVLAFVLLQQVLIAPPTNNAQRIGDVVLLAVATLTGPFGIVFLPLFAWRWWRDRRQDNAIAIAIVAICAAIQVYFLIRTGPRFEFQAEPFRAWPALVVLARRLVVWPLLGTDPALEFSPAVIATIGGGAMLFVFAVSLSAHPRRRLRTLIVAAFALIIIAGIYRTRPDTWKADNLVFGDRYFYIPRVLLAWLVIWQIDEGRRWIAIGARLLCVAVLVVHLRSFVVPAPVDYHWAEHVAPIRQGVPAEIPTLPEGWTLEYRGRPTRQP